jgi:hypothetical protein
VVVLDRIVRSTDCGKHLVDEECLCCSRRVVDKLIAKGRVIAQVRGEPRYLLPTDAGVTSDKTWESLVRPKKLGPYPEPDPDDWRVWTGW